MNSNTRSVNPCAARTKTKKLYFQVLSGFGRGIPLGEDDNNRIGKVFGYLWTSGRNRKLIE